MSVIVTDMDMPKQNNCRFCEKTCFWQGADVDRNNHTEDCPLKSVEELIEKIEEKATMFDKINNPWGDVYVKNPYRECIKDIKEYCEVSE